MSIRAINWAFSLSIAPTPKLILIAIADHADDDGVCWPSLERVADKASVNRRTVMRHVEEFAAAGLLTLEHRRDEATGLQLPNRYRLKMTVQPGDNLSPGGVQPGDKNGAQPGDNPGDRAVSPQSSVLEPSEEEPSEPPPVGRESLQTSQVELMSRDHADDPKWLSALHEIPSWPCLKDAAVMVKVAEHQVTDSDALLAATALVSKWADLKGRYKRADLTFVHWALSEQKRNKIGGSNGTSRGYRAPVNIAHEGVDNPFSDFRHMVPGASRRD
jgi:hypothetical protein